MLLRVIITFLAITFATTAFADAPDTSQKPPEKAAEEKNPSETSEKASSEAKNEQLQIDNTINADCAEIFTNFVNKNGTVDYAYLRRKRSKLISFERKFSDLEVEEYLTWDDAEQVAFWINAHNIFTLKLIVDNYPIEPSRLKMIFYPASSIMQIKNARTEHFYNIMGREYNLKELEKYVAELYKDPRIFFTLTYASYSSAPLRNEPYLGHKLESQIDDQIRKYLSSEYGMKIDTEKEEIQLSDIFNWYKSYFLETYQTNERFRARRPEIRAYFNFINQYAPSKKRFYLDKDDFKVEFQRYNWLLNNEPFKKDKD